MDNNNNHNNKSSLHDLDDLYIESHKDDLSIAKRKIWQKIQISQNESIKKRPFLNAAKYAAILLLGLGIGYTLSNYTNSDQELISSKGTHLPSIDSVYQSSQSIIDSNYHRPTVITTHLPTPHVLNKNNQQINAYKSQATSIQKGNPDFQANIEKPNQVENLEHPVIVNNNEKNEEFSPKNIKIQPRVIHINEVSTPIQYTAGRSHEALYKIHKNASTPQQDHQFNIKFNKF